MLRFTMQFWFVGPALALFAMGTPLRPVAADPPTADRWSIVVTTAPHHPQDVWFSGMGNNVDGWGGGDCTVTSGITFYALVDAHAKDEGCRN